MHENVLKSWQYLLVIPSFIISFSVPGAPYDIRVTKQDETIFVIHWKSPSEPNGIILGYKVT